MNIEKGRLSLEQAGLNIFLSSKVEALSPTLLKHFSAQGISWVSYETFVLIGHGGKKLWDHLEHPLDAKEHPIDALALRKMRDLNEEVLKDPHFLLVYPEEKWTLPLQHLGRFFHFCGPSPIGIDISREFGLWFAFRGAFFTKASLPSLAGKKNFDSPCSFCLERPCEKQASLEEARLACPYKNEHQYGPEQRAYHQRALVHINKFKS